MKIISALKTKDMQPCALIFRLRGDTSRYANRLLSPLTRNMLKEILYAEPTLLLQAKPLGPCPLHLLAHSKRTHNKATSNCSTAFEKSSQANTTRSLSSVAVIRSVRNYSCMIVCPVQSIAC